MAKTNNLTIEQTTALRAIARGLGLIAVSGPHVGDGSVKQLFDGLAAGTLRVTHVHDNNDQSTPTMFVVDSSFMPNIDSYIEKREIPATNMSLTCEQAAKIAYELSQS